MKKLIVVALLSLGMSAHAEPYFQHASLQPSDVKGELMVLAAKTNAGWSQKTLLPIFYRNASAGDAWWKPSMAPLVLGGNFGAGNAAADIGALVDVGPQIIAGVEQIVGVFSGNAKASVTQFFNCSASATACAALSTGAMFNLNVEENGDWSTSGHALLRHPVAYTLGPSLYFGKKQDKSTAYIPSSMDPSLSLAYNNPIQ